MRRFLLRVLLPLSLLAMGAFYLLSQPKRINPALISGLSGDISRGERVFYLGGCAACHSAAKATEKTWLQLGGGRRFASPFGTFTAPNISPDMENGIGGWSTLDLVNAMRFGTSPNGQHYYPAFPYTSYARVPLQDIVDLKVFLDNLPAVATANQPSDIPFPFNIRRGIGLWKRLYLDVQPLLLSADLSPQAQRGAMLANGLGHCAACHTPRNPIGGMDKTRWLGGAPDPNSKGSFPNLTPHKDGLAWTAEDIAEYLKSGFTPEYDVAGGAMVEVIANTSKLEDSDRAAIAAYLKSLTPVAKRP